MNTYEKISKITPEAIAALPDLLAALEQMKPIIEAFLMDELSVTTIQEAGDIFHDVYLPALTKAGYTFQKPLPAAAALRAYAARPGG